MPTCQDQPDAAQVYLSDLSPKDKPWDRHRTQATAVSTLYRRARPDYADRIADCSKLLGFRLSPDLSGSGDLGLKLHSARFCRVRHCPVCQWRRSMRWRARFLDALPRLVADHPTARFIFLTLTVRNCPVTDLRATLAAMGKAWQRLSQRKTWPALGWVRSVEVTRNPTTGEAHPHYHVLMAVRPNYFSRNYINQATWRELWQSALRVDYLPVVNVKTVKPDKDGSVAVGVLEVLKYGVKPEDLEFSEAWLLALTEQLHKTRAVAVGGIFKEYISEEEPEDLIGESEEEEAGDSSDLYFGWRESYKRYLKINH